MNLITLEGHTTIVHSLDWDPAGARLVSCGNERTIYLWDTNTGRLLHTIEASDGGRVYAVAWSPDGLEFASAGEDGTIRIFDAETNEEVQRFELKLGMYSRGLDWSHDGRWLAAAADTGEVKVWDVASGEEIAQFRKRDQALFTVRFSRDGTKLAAGGKKKPLETAFGEGGTGTDGMITIWDLHTRQEQHRLHGHTNSVRSLDWSDDGARLISAGHDGQIVVWDSATGAQLLVLRNPESDLVLSAQFSPDELKIASVGASSGIRLWDATAGYAMELSDRLLDTMQARIAANPTFDDLKLRGEIYARQGNWEEAANDFDAAAKRAGEGSGGKGHHWFTSPWWVVGPYPGPLTVDQSPRTNLNPLAPVPPASNAEPLKWMPAVLSEGQGLNLGRFFHQAENISGYAQLRIYSPTQQRAAVLFGADDALKLWFNDNLIHSREQSRRALRDDEAAEIELRQGWNLLLAKVYNASGDNGLFLRLTDEPLAVARVFARNGQWDKALTWWDHALPQRPDDPEVLLGRGRAALGTDRMEVAEESFGALLADHEPLSVRAVAAAYAAHARTLIDAGRVHDAANMLAQSRTLYETLVPSGEGTEQDALGLAEVLFLMQVERRSLMAEESNNPWVRLYNAYLAAGDSEHAIDAIARALERMPNFAERQVLVKQLDQEGVEVGSLLARRSDDPLLLATWAGHQAAAGRTDEAAEAFGKACRQAEALLAESPSDESLAGFLADLLLAEPGSQKVPNAARLASLGPWTRLGAAYAALGDSQQAARWFTWSLEQTKGFAARLELVDSISQSRVALDGFLQLYPNDPLLLRALATRQAANGQAEAAAASLARARTLARSLLAKSPTDEALGGFLADLLLTELERRSGPDEPANVELQRRRVAATQLQGPWLRLAVAYSLHDNAKDAATWFARVLDGEPDFARQLDLLEQIAELRSNLEDVKKLRPDSPAFEGLRLRRQFRETASFDDTLAEQFFAFLEKRPDVDRRSLLRVNEFAGVVDGDRFEEMLEHQFAQTVTGVRQQVWTRQPPQPVVSHLLKPRKLAKVLIDNQEAKGLRPTFLSTSCSAGAPLFVTIWTDAAADHSIDLALTRQEFSDKLARLKDSMQLTSLEEYQDGMSTRYAAVWVKPATPAPWELHERQSEAETVRLAGVMRDQGYRPAYVNVYPDGTLTTIWVQDDGAWQLLLGLTYQDLQKLERERFADCLPIGIDSYFDGKRRRYCVILDGRFQGVDWKFMTLVRRDEFNRTFDDNLPAGYWPIVTTEAPVNATDREDHEAD